MCVHGSRVSPLPSVFSPILGMPSWGVAKGYGSSVTMEFGEPQLVVRDPTMRQLRIEGAPSRTWIREANVHGQWHLWIYGCEWSLALEGAQLADSGSDGIRMARALHVLNGQALTGVDVSPTDGGSTFGFDLGCLLTTRPAAMDTRNEGPAEQWFLYQPSGDVLTIRGDGHYRVRPGNEGAAGDDGWEPLPVPNSVGED